MYSIYIKGDLQFIKRRINNGVQNEISLEKHVKSGLYNVY